MLPLQILFWLNCDAPKEEDIHCHILALPHPTEDLLDKWSFKD